MQHFINNDDIVQGIQWCHLVFTAIWWLCRQKQVSQTGISNYILQFTVWCNYLSLSEIPASGNKVHIYKTYIYARFVFFGKCIVE